MIDRRIQTNENIDEDVLNRHSAFAHEIDGTHREYKNADDFNSLDDAIDGCGAAGSPPCVLAITRSLNLGSNKTILTHVHVLPINGGKIILGANNLTVNGGWMAGLYECIDDSGAGVITFDGAFIMGVHPQWWGAKVDGSTNDDGAINSAVAATVTSKVPVLFSPGDWVFDSIGLGPGQQLIGSGSAITTLTRVSTASGEAIGDSGGAAGDATDIVLKGFTLDCDFKGTDGIVFGDGATAFSGNLEDIKVLDCAGNSFELTITQATGRNLHAENADGGGVGDYQFFFDGNSGNFYNLTAKGEAGTTANVGIFNGSTGEDGGLNIFGLYIEDPHLTKAIRFSNCNHNAITGITFRTEGNSKTYTQLVFFESGGRRNTVRDLSIKQQASDTITNAIEDDTNSITIGYDSTILLTTFIDYSQTDAMRNVPDNNVLPDEATPTVLAGTSFVTGGTTTITDFDDGFPGKIIRIVAEHSLIITDGTNIFLPGSANFNMNPTDTLTLIQKADGKWYTLAAEDNT